MSFRRKTHGFLTVAAFGVAVFASWNTDASLAEISGGLVPPAVGPVVGEPGVPGPLDGGTVLPGSPDDGAGVDGELGAINPKKLLRHPRIVFSTSARRDLKRGAVAPNLLALLSEAARRWTISVSVFGGGHSTSTESGYVSDHVCGDKVRRSGSCAVDIGSFNGKACISHRVLCRRTAAWAARRKDFGVKQVITDAPLGIPGTLALASHADHNHWAVHKPAGWMPSGTNIAELR